MYGRDIFMLAIGGILGAGVARIILKRQYEEQIDIEIEELKEYYNSKYASPEVITGTRDIDPLKNEDTSEHGVKHVDNYVKIAKRYGKDYSDPSEAVRELQDVVDNAPHQPTIDERSNQPYIITDEEFNEECLNYDKVTLFYYTVDDTLTDEQEQQIDDRQRLLGMENIEPDEDPSALYVRNERLMIDYEITFIYGSYKDCVCGPDSEED